MRLYRFPKWLRWMYPGAIFDYSHKGEKSIYLTFDDGPNPEITEYILNVLAQYDAKATFFCLGQQVEKHPELFQEITAQGHTVGHHSYTHPNGWWSINKRYLADVDKAAKIIPSKLFRPPYGRLSFGQNRQLKKRGYQVVFWTVVSYDFDPALRKKDLIKKMKRLSEPGAIFVFHDNPKAVPVLKNELPKLMDFWKAEGYRFKSIPNN